MKKIAIITLIGHYNYGNRLQNYAVQEVLKTLGFSVETVHKEKFKSTKEKYNFLDIIFKIRKITLKKIYDKVSKLILVNINKKYIIERRRIFIDFTKKYIKDTMFTITEEKLPNELFINYDYYITGSDQVWRPVNNKVLSIYFLRFAPELKRIAYAPSFGVSSIPEKHVEQYKDWLSEIPFLSVREESGAKIIKELTGRDVPVLVDPTLMLTREKWLSIAKEDPYKPDRPYLLTYFLGKVPKEIRKRIKKIARDNNLEIVRLADIRDKKRYIAGPSEFIDYINSAALVCTDSFHGSVFSILMETPFIVFDRLGTSMYSRIETLLNKFNLNLRQANNITTNEQIFNMDFSHIPPILEEERRKALSYLKEALNIKENN